MFNLLFTYEGRINRAKWWLALLLYFIALMLLTLLVAIVTAVAFGMELGEGLGALTIALVIWYLLFVISGSMVGIKRCHDRNKSGWWMLLFLGVPVVTGILQVAIDPESGLYILISLIGFVIGIWSFVELGCLRGTIGPNQYGPDPLPPKA